MLTTAIMDGNWSDPQIWDDGLPTPDSSAIIGKGFTVQLDGSSQHVKDLVIHGNLVVPEEISAPDKSLIADWVHVNSGGQFIVGTENNRYDEGTFALHLVGTDLDTTKLAVKANGETIELANNDGFLMTGGMGRIQFYGQDKISFTKLAKTAGINDPAIVVANTIERNFNLGTMNGDEFVTSPEDDGALNWEIGDQIVIASSSYDYREESVRTIANILDNGDGTTTLTLDQPLDRRHYGEIETYGESVEPGTTAPSETYKIDMRAEVALLSRNVKVQGLSSQDTDSEFGDRANAIYQPRIRAAGLSDQEAAKAPDLQVANGIGGHIMFMHGSGQIIVDGVQLDGLGQSSQKGRYPIHWHMGSNRPNDVLRNSSVTNSNNRGVTIHGTSDLTIEGVVLHDIHGHGFFFEDAVETNNSLVGNIALGIHTVGGNDDSAANPGGKDPFIVDTHDSVLETPSRFSSSAAYWITNPNNNFVGNIAAGAGDSRTDEHSVNEKFADPGPAGTGFWFAIPRTAVGISSDRPEYANVRPIFAEFGQFDYNLSHTTAIGLNFDRGSDIEDANFDSDFDFGSVHIANEYEPRSTPSDPSSTTTNFVNGFTNYKAAEAAMYHRGKAKSIQFNDLRIADSYNGPWSVSENNYNNSLYVGHSRGNSDLTARVGGPRLYDGAGLHTNAHFAGFGNPNAVTFQVESSSFGPTMYHGLVGVSFEDDSTYDRIAHAVADSNVDENGELLGHNLGRSHEWIKAVMDLDGSLTSAAGGGAGFSIVPNVAFLVDSEDIQPENLDWDAWLTEDIYARIRVENLNDGSDRNFFDDESDGRPVIIFTAQDGDVANVMVGQNNGDHSWTQIAAKTDLDGNVEDDFVITFGKQGIPTGGFVLNLKNQDGGLPALNPEIQSKVDSARIVLKLTGAGNYTPDQGTEVFDETSLRTATSQVVYFRDEFGNLLVNSGISDSQPLIKLQPGSPLQSAFVERTIEYGTIIQAEEFDNSFGNLPNIAYSDSDPENSLGEYRNETGVDATSSFVGDTVAGEWLEYTATIVPSAYNIGLNVASSASGGQIRVLGAASNSAGFLTEFGIVDVPNTDGDFETVWLEGANLATIAGSESVIRLEVVQGGFELDSIEFTAATQTPYVQRTITSDSTTTTIELEEYDRGGQGAAYNDTDHENKASDSFRIDEGVDTNGQILTDDVLAGEWVEYTTDVQAGVYNITLAKSWSAGDSRIKLLIGDSNAATEFTELGEFLVSNEAANDQLTLPNVDLSSWQGAGRVLRVEMLGSYFGIDSISFDFVGTAQSAYVSREIGQDASTRIELEEYDVGGQDVAYSDTSPGNNASETFRTDQNVDTNGDILTNDVIDGEWLEYTTDIVPGLYDITLDKSWSAGDASVRLLVAASSAATEFTPLGEFSFPAGGQQLITLPSVDLSAHAGINRVLRIEIVGSFMGLNALDFSPASDDTIAPNADIVDVSPDPRNTDAGVVTIQFDEDVVGLDINDLELRKDGEELDLKDLDLVQVSGSEYTLDLSSVTASDGSYEFRLNSLGSGVEDLAGNALVSDAVDHFRVDRTGPQVESIVINDGAAQRSMVNSLTVTFSEVVQGVDTDAFVLTNLSTNTQVVPIVNTQIIGGKTIATLTFAGEGIVGGSLADGNYTLTTLASSVADTAGNQLDGNRDGTSGDDATDEFFRLFGDSNGDRRVNIIDFFDFRSAFRDSLLGNRVDQAFDSNGDGKINILDFFHFRRQFGKTI